MRGGPGRGGPKDCEGFRGGRGEFRGGRGNYHTGHQASDWIASWDTIRAVESSAPVVAEAAPNEGPALVRTAPVAGAGVAQMLTAPSAQQQYGDSNPAMKRGPVKLAWAQMAGKDLPKSGRNRGRSKTQNRSDLAPG